MPKDYLNRILNARVYDVAEGSPLDAARSLSARLDNNVLIKREDLQAVSSALPSSTAESTFQWVICSSLYRE